MMSAQSEIVELLKHGIALFEKLTGVPYIETKQSNRIIYSDAFQMLESLFEAVELDQTGVTAILLLRYYSERYLSNKQFNWLELIRHPERLDSLALPREIVAVIEDERVADVSDRFQGQLKKALEKYGAADRDDVKELLAQPDNIAFLRRDALRSIKKLRVDQFLDGDDDPVDTVPVYAKYCHQWWNINSMIEQLTRLPSGVSLNFLRSPDGYSSFFAFAIRNGGRLFVLSDVEPEEHPLKGLMSRRPERTLERRMARNWFPYELLNLQYTEDDKLYIDQASKSTDIAVRQANTIPVKAISELAAETVVWTAMMFELIIEKFWRSNYRAPELSYTGEMIRKEAVLLSSAQKAGLPVPAYKEIGLTPVTKELVKSDASKLKHALGNTPDNPNQWMLDRYGDRCTEDSLNLLSMPTDFYLIGGDNAISKLTDVEVGKMGHFEKRDLMRSSARIHQLPATAFGTKERLDNDRIWLARHSWATQIQLAANKEFELRKDEVLRWFVGRVTANLPKLKTIVGHGRLFRYDFGTLAKFGSSMEVMTGAQYQCRDDDRDGGGTTSIEIMCTVSRDEHKKGRNGNWWYGTAIRPAADIGIVSTEPPCVFTGSKSSYMVTFFPIVAEDIAFLAGCEVAELPDVLQGFNAITPYTGNSILRRIDPAVSVLSNPWFKLNFLVRIGLSKRGMKEALQIRDMGVLEKYCLQKYSDRVA